MTLGFIYSKLLSESIKDRAKTANIKFASLNEKYQFLYEMSCDGFLVGSPACELFNIAGNKPLLWIDIDTKLHGLFREWRSSQDFPFPEGSYKACFSATKNIHLYVHTDRKVEKDETFSIKEWIIERTPQLLKTSIDRIYGPKNLEPVFSPRTVEGKMILPQVLMRDQNETFEIPGTIESSVYSEWKKRNTIKNK